MAEVKVLIKGYVREEGDIEFVSSTTVLIQEKDINIIVDPGMNRQLLLDSLKKENLTPNDINYVVLTHYHLDHSLLAGIFENAKVLDNSNIHTWDGKIEEHTGKIPGTDIELINTPGHDPFHCTVLVKTEKGIIAIAADVFWWADEEEQKTDTENLINREDPYVKNKEKLTESRKKVLELADYVIPGHGKMFKVEKT
jgi:glyoxylase-like metal-dependent hydrolase (beta-lactamase superfamily II)